MQNTQMIGERKLSVLPSEGVKSVHLRSQLNETPLASVSIEMEGVFYLIFIFFIVGSITYAPPPLTPFSLPPPQAFTT